MNVLIVASGNSNDISPFIKEQVDSLINLDVKIQYFLIKGNGSIGYLQNIVKHSGPVCRFPHNIYEVGLLFYRR